MKLYGLWYGGGSYTYGDIDNDLEVFDSLADAKYSLSERYDTNGMFKCGFAYVYRDSERNYCPCVDRNSTIDLYKVNPNEEYSHGPDYTVKFGPRGGVVVERY